MRKTLSTIATAFVWTRRVACSSLSSAGAVAVISLTFGGYLLLREVKAQTQDRQLYVQVSMSGEQMAALTNATAIINAGRNGESNNPFVTPEAVFMTITIKEINALCDRLISTDPKTLVRRFNKGP